MPLTSTDPAEVAAGLTRSERGALLSLPVRDRGDFPDEVWYAYSALIDAGLTTSAGDFLMVRTPLGEAVITLLRGEAAEGNPPPV